MKIANLHELMVSITDFKKQIAGIIKDKATKIIVRNNEPVYVFLPYSEYVLEQDKVKTIGEDITLKNGVQIKIVSSEEERDVVIKTYVKMKTTGEYKLHFTHSISSPSVDSTLTNQELEERYWKENNK